MEKFLFIIPKVNLYVCITLFFTTGFPLKLFATDGVDGCHIVTMGGQERNYHTPFSLGAGSPTEWIATSAGAGGGGYNLNTASKCIQNVGASCIVYKFGTGPSPIASDILYIGNYAIMISCPIDDYIPALFIFTIAIFLYRNKNLHLINESKPDHCSL